MHPVAIFGAGNARRLELTFRTLPGVVKVETGFSGGDLDNPTAAEVNSDTTGHAHVVRIEFNATVLSYDDLLERFWSSHDPTTINQQGTLVGSQYRSVIFHLDDAQRAAAVASRERLRSSGRFRRAIVTEISEAGEFFPSA